LKQTRKFLQSPFSESSGGRSNFNNYNNWGGIINRENDIQIPNIIFESRTEGCLKNILDKIKNQPEGSRFLFCNKSVNNFYERKVAVSICIGRFYPFYQVLRPDSVRDIYSCWFK
jgi:hypothetical protein